MRVRRSLHLATAALVASGAFLAATSTAATGKTFYLRMEGCGATAEPGRLDTKKGADGATGCGTRAGIPLDEVIHQAEGSTPDTYTTGTAGMPLKLGSGEVTGTIAFGSWIGNGTGGVGTVTADVGLVGVTASGANVDFGTVTVNGQASPGQDVAKVDFKLPVPGASVGSTFKKFTLSVVQRGLNFGMSAYQLDGDSLVVIPQK